MVVAEVGEHRHVEVDALDARLDERVARHLHRHSVPMAVGLLAVAHPGQDPLHLGRLGCRPRARQRPHDVGRTAGRAEQIAQQLGHRRLPVGAGHADHQQIAGWVAVEGGRQPRHHGAHGAGCDPRLHHVVVDQLGNEVLAEEPDGAAVHRLGGVDVPVADADRERSRRGPRARPGGCRARCRSPRPRRGRRRTRSPLCRRRGGSWARVAWSNRQRCMPRTPLRHGRNGGVGQVHVMSWAWAAADSVEVPGVEGAVCTPGVVGMS